MDQSPSPVSDFNWEKYIKSGHPETAIAELWMFAVDDVDKVRRHVAENPICPQDLLRVLAIDQHTDVRIAVAEHPQTPADVLEQLSKDENDDLRYALAENPHMPLAIISRLTEDENPFVSHRAHKTLRRLQSASVVELKPRNGGSGAKFANGI